MVSIPRAARLPNPRGPLSAAALDLVRDGAAPRVCTEGADPFGDDLTVALHTCYYQGFAEVAPDVERSPALLAFREQLERVFEQALRDSVKIDEDVAGALDELRVEPVPGNGISHFLRDEGEWWQLCEYVIHRSVHHREADPVSPLVAGRAELYRELMATCDLDTGYLSYFDDVPAPVIAGVNMMSLFGLHRRLRGALAGHLAAAEITTAPSAARMVTAVERLGGDPRFFAAYGKADEQAVHDLLDREPELAADVVFGVRATEFLEARFAEHVLASWRWGTTSLRAN